MNTENTLNTGGHCIKKKGERMVNEKMLILAKDKIVRAIIDVYPKMYYEEVSEYAEKILEMIDWENETLMHKDIEWITLFYFERLRKN